jgi:predicted dehydrogenase
MADHQEMGIGVVGAGLIVQNAHLPAYRSAGYRVEAITDQNVELAAQVAATWGLRHARTVDELVADPNVTVIDIAITPEGQNSAARKAFVAGKHVLAQKPLASTLEAARSLVEAAKQAGVVLAVNQQQRWAPAFRAFSAALDDGFLGDPITLSYRVDIAGEYSPEHWLSQLPRFMATYGTIHYIDSARALFGEPEFVTARLLSSPGQVSAGETFINAWIEWASGVRMIVFERYTNAAVPEPSVIRLDGTRGSVRARLGVYDDYPRPIPDVVERSAHDDGEWENVSDGSTWLPDAFAGPMGSLLDAVLFGGEPETSGLDNLKTLEVVEALYRSDSERRTVRIAP